MTAPPASMRLLGSRDVSGVVEVHDVEGLVDLLRPLPARIEPLLVVAAQSQVAAARHTLSLARAGAPGATGVVHGSSLPPLARRGLVELLASWSQTLNASQLLVLCEAIERVMVAGVALTSVARLSDPGPSMAQHVRSWWPASRFVALTQPTSRVVTVGGDYLESLRLPGSGVPLHFAATAGDPVTETVVRGLAELLTGHAPTVVDAPPDSAARWGTTGFIEFCAVPQDLSPLVRTALDSAQECRSCGAALAWDQCRFCHARRPVAELTAEPHEPTEPAAPTPPRSPVEPAAPSADLSTDLKHADWLDAMIDQGER